MRYSIIVVLFVLLSSCTFVSSNSNTGLCCNNTPTILTLTQKWTEISTLVGIDQTPTITGTSNGNLLPLDPELSWKYRGIVDFIFLLMSNSIQLKADYYFAICCNLLTKSVINYYAEPHMNEMGWVYAGGGYVPGASMDTYLFTPNFTYLTISERGCEDNSKEWCINIWISK